MWRKLALTGWYFIVSILVLVAIAVGVIRGYSSLYERHLPVIQQNISSVIGKPVHTGGIDFTWYGYTPYVTVKDLTIYADETRAEQLLFAKEAHLLFDLYASLVHKRFDIRRLTLVGSDLKAVRTADKRIMLSGIDVSEKFAGKEALEQETEISFVGSTISIRDDVRNLDYFFDHVDVALGFYQDRLKVSSKIFLPETLGDSFTLVADVHNLEQGLDNVEGNLYAQGNSINLELLGDFFPHLQAGIKAGSSDFEVWGDFNSSLQRSFNGRLSVRDLQYHHVKRPIEGVSVGQEITSLDTRFLVKGEEENWHLALTDSTVQAAGEQWFGKQYEIRCIDCDGSSFSVAAALDYVDSNHLLSTLQHYSVFTAPLEQLRAKVRIGGVFDSTNILTRWDDGQLSKYSYKTSLQDVQVSIPDQEFEASSLNGTAYGNHLQGSLEIDAPDLRIQAGSVWDSAFAGQKVAGAIKWKHTDHGIVTSLENVSLEAPGIDAGLQGHVRVDDGKLYLDLQGEVPEARLAITRDYLPLRKMNPKLAKWLKESVSGGALKNARFVFRGNPEHFPFKDHSGVFQAVASVEDGILNYFKDWPNVHDLHAGLTIENGRLVVSGRQGTILNSSIDQVTATIDNLKLPRLVIDGEVSGPAGDILDYLQQSSLMPQNSRIPRHISLAGNTKLDLGLVLTLTRKLEKERAVKGVIEFDDTDLTVTSAALPFKNLKGKLKFDRHELEAQGLSAVLHGSVFNADARSLKGGGTLLTIVGDFNVDAYLAANNYEQAGKYIKGTAPVRATINLPRFGKHDGDKSMSVNVDSNLRGTSIDLPKPFYKEVDDDKQFALHTKYQAGEKQSLFANFDDRLFMQASFDETESTISAMELRMGDDQFSLPKKGLKISGVFNQLNPTDWEGVFKSSGGNGFLELSEVDVQSDRIFLSDLDIRDVDFQLLKEAKSWTGKIDSSVAKGSFSYPLNSSTAGIVTADFDYLYISKPEEEIIELDPRKLLALEVHAKQFEFDEYPFRNVVLKTIPVDDGMKINSLTGEGEDMQVKMEGTWVVDEKNTHNTDLDIVVKTQNLHDSLVGLGFESAVSEGRGRVTAKFNWPDTPYQFSAESLTGTTNLRLNDGKISSVEPGEVGRLVGLFNLGEISRRLSLDFTDFFSKGYTFEKIRGDLFFKDANLTTENLSIKGPSADILIEGRTGIAARDYDQVVTVTPHVAGGLPWVGLAVGGPIGAVGVYIGEKVASKIGIDVNKVTEVKYSLTGSWDDPKIEPIAKVEASSPDKVEESPPDQDQP